MGLRSASENRDAHEAVEHSESVLKSVAAAAGNVFRSLWVMVLFGVAWTVFLLSVISTVYRIAGDSAELSAGIFALLLAGAAVGLITGMFAYFGKSAEKKERGRRLIRATGNAALAEYITLAFAGLAEWCPMYDYSIGWMLSGILIALIPVAGIAAGVISWKRYGRQKETSKQGSVILKIVRIVAIIIAAALALLILYAIIMPFIIVY